MNYGRRDNVPSRLPGELGSTAPRHGEVKGSSGHKSVNVTVEPEALGREVFVAVRHHCTGASERYCARRAVSSHDRGLSRPCASGDGCAMPCGISVRLTGSVW